MDEINEQPVKRKRGRPKGSKDKVPRKKPEMPEGHLKRIDPNTGVIVPIASRQGVTIAKMGDERVSAFVAYHMECLKMREGCNKKDVPDLYQRLYRYLSYCAEHGVIPNNMNAYLAIGVSKQDISLWYAGNGSPEQRKFAEDIKAFFASIHEQGGGEGIVNPILSIFWSKAHDGMSDQPKVEVQLSDALGDRRSAEEIAKTYADILPED